MGRTEDVNRTDNIPNPVERTNLRLLLGSVYFSLKRQVQWHKPGVRYARERIETDDATKSFSYRVFSHQSQTLRELRNVDSWMQLNKVRNLQLAVAKLDGLVLNRGETFSLWRLVGRPSKRKGYLPGMVLVNGEMRAGIGGGLCQLSNLIYWMTLHTDLTVTERFRHQYDVFPDANRTLPFGSGSTIAYNYIDLQIRNNTNHSYCLVLRVTPTRLVGEWRSNVPESYHYEVVERNHRITQHVSGRYLRHNEIWRRRLDDEGTCVTEECVAENHAIMMYSPLLQAPAHNADEGSHP